MTEELLRRDNAGTCAFEEELPSIDKKCFKDLLIRQLEQQLCITHEQLVAVREQLETSQEGFLAANEELMSINEEFQSANEELQSANEELGTSREELQLLNEELVTINDELQEKVEELNQANSDMENLFACSGIATIFLDKNLIIKSFSPAMAVVLGLKQSDINCPFRRFAGMIDGAALSHDAEMVLAGHSFAEREVELPDNERCYLKRIFPYRAIDGRIDGIVIDFIDITEHKQAEEATRSTALFPLENPNPVMRISRDRKLLFSNRAADPLLRQWRMDFTAGLPDILLHNMERSLENGGVLEFDLNVFERDINFCVVSFPERDYVNIYGRDITEQKRAERLLLRAKEDWERTFNSVPDLIAILDLEHRIVRVNQTMAARLGVTPEACAEQLCFMSMHGSGCPPASCPHALTLSDGLEHEAELYVERLGADFLVTTTPLLDENGQMVGTVHVARDITERRRVEKLQQSAHERLEKLVKERTEDLTKTVDTLQLEIFERVAAEENLLRLNRLYALLSETNQIIVRAENRETLFREFCSAAVEKGGFILSWLGLVDKQDGQVRIAASYGKTAYLDGIGITVKDEPQGLGPTGISIREGTCYISNDFQNDPCTRPWHDRGRAHGIHASASVALKEEGQVVGALTLYAEETGFFDKQQIELLLQMGADISFALDRFCLEVRRRETEQALQDETLERLRTVEALREKEQLLIHQSRLAAMGEMIGNIAHQWRQPLNLLALKIQQMQIYYENGLFSAEFLDETVNKSMRQIEHMSQTIDDFRNYFIPDKEKTDFSPNEVISATFTLLGDGFKHQHIDLELKCPNFDEQRIFGFPNEYSQALLNIILNAKDALLEKKPAEPKVTVTVTAENGRSVVLINDNAGGIPDGIIEKIFDPYFTTKGPHEGTGVGLFMSRTIIEKNMQGRLTVRNAEEGAEFRIEV